MLELAPAVLRDVRATQQRAGSSATVNDVLLAALARLSAYDWTLTCAGSLERDPTTASHVRALATTLGLAALVEWLRDREAARRLGEEGRAVVSSVAGAAAKHLEHLGPLLGG